MKHFDIFFDRFHIFVLVGSKARAGTGSTERSPSYISSQRFTHQTTMVSWEN